jgi:hypothetical protein
MGRGWCMSSDPGVVRKASCAPLNLVTYGLPPPRCGLDRHLAR